MECELALVGAVRDADVDEPQGEPERTSAAVQTALGCLVGGASIAEAWEEARRCGRGTCGHPHRHGRRRGSDDGS